MNTLCVHMLLLLVCIGMYPAHAQTTFYQRDSSIKVYAYGRPQTLAWCGGFNSSQFAMGDLNNDGLQDLVVFDAEVGLRTFINKGTVGNPSYQFAPEYALNFPPVLGYLQLADYNCDGIPDLFQQSLGIGSTVASGFSVYKGYYNSANQLCFTFYKNLLYNDPFLGLQYTYCNPGDIPAIVDVDNDGDLDFLSYDIDGLHMWLFKNMRMELGLPCDSIVIELTDRCWGRFTSGVGPSLLLGCTIGGHPGNNACLVDFDMDGDYDYFGGKVGYSNIFFLENGRIPYNPSGADSMVYQDATWQSSGTKANVPGFPAAYNIDVDQDGKKDLVIAPNYTELGQNYNSIWYYKNLGVPGGPNWQFQSDSFLTDQTIDIGSSAHPTLFDINKDGKPDLIIGSVGYYQDSSGSMRSRISCYINTSTPGSPSFTLQTKDLLGIDSFNFVGAAPAFGDIDNDGKADLIIGHTDGTLSYFKNMAASDLVAPDWQLAQLYLKDVNGDTINTEGSAAPMIYDVDKDGKNDLVIGSTHGGLYYYQNVSTTPGNIQLKLINTHLGNAYADARYTYTANSTPFIGKIDTTNTDYLLMGSNSGNIYLYSGIGSGDTAATYALLDSQYSYTDTTYNLYNHPGTTYGIYSSHYTSPVIGDVAGDGTLYMIVGTTTGGVELYKRGVYAGAGVATIPGQSKFALYPNPTSERINVAWQNAAAQSTILRVC